MKTEVVTVAPASKASKPRASVDWQAVERDYRAGIMSLREMGTLHSVSHVAIKKQADKNGWVRDLAAKIQARADELVNKSLVTTELTRIAKVSENQTVEANGLQVANVKLGMRKGIGRLLAITESMMAELEAQIADPDLLEQFTDLMRNPDDKGQDKLNDLMQKIISLPGRVDTLKKLSESMRACVTMQREAWGMDLKGADEPPKTSMAAWLESMQTRRSALPIVHEVERDDAL